MIENAPFSRLVKVDALPQGGLTQVIEANAAERSALATLNDLQALAKLTATLTILRSGRGGVRVKGAVHAQATQTCVISLEPMDVVIDEPVDVRFAPQRESAKRGPALAGETLDWGDAEQPDPIIDGKIDLGALASEFMALALDPYPRKPGVAFEAPAITAEPGSAPDGPDDLPKTATKTAPKPKG